jgi:hypothetical protein
MLTGQLPPGMEAQAQKYEQDLISSVESYLAHAGIQDSTMREEYIAYAKQQGAIYRQQLAAQMLQSGYAGIGTALGPSQAAGGTAAAVLGGTGNQLTQANASLAKLLGAQG